MAEGPPILADRPRLLFLSQTLPFPPDGGVKVRTFHILRQLARTFDITALCFARRGTTTINGGVAGLSEFARVEAFPIPQEHGRLRWLADHCRSLLHQQVYTHYVYQSPAFGRRLIGLLREPWAMVHADSLDLAGYLPLISHAPIACTHHDIQSVLLRRRAAVTPAGPQRWYLQHQAMLMQMEERYWAPKVALNVVVSEVDAALIRERAPSASIAVIPNGVDTAYFSPTEARGTRIVFVGGSDWFPNRDGMLWFVHDILPLLRRARPEARVCWVGRIAPELRARVGALGVETPGHVDDVRPFLRDAACVIVPLRVGGGTRIKILDAWAMGRPVVSTTIGAEGLDGSDDVSLLLRDSTDAFATAVLAVLDDPGRAARLGAAGRLLVESRYGWEQIGERMRTLYTALGPEPR